MFWLVENWQSLVKSINASTGSLGAEGIQLAWGSEGDLRIWVWDRAVIEIPFTELIRVCHPFTRWDGTLTLRQCDWLWLMNCKQKWFVLLEDQILHCFWELFSLCCGWLCSRQLLLWSLSSWVSAMGPAFCGLAAWIGDKSELVLVEKCLPKDVHVLIPGTVTLQGWRDLQIWPKWGPWGWGITLGYLDWPIVVTRDWIDGVAGFEDVGWGQGIQVAPRNSKT